VVVTALAFTGNAVLVPARMLAQTCSSSVARQCARSGVPQQRWGLWAGSGMRWQVWRGMPRCHQAMRAKVKGVRVSGKRPLKAGGRLGVGSVNGAAARGTEANGKRKLGRWWCVGCRKKCGLQTVTQRNRTRSGSARKSIAGNVLFRRRVEWWGKSPV